MAEDGEFQIFGIARLVRPKNGQKIPPKEDNFNGEKIK